MSNSTEPYLGSAYVDFFNRFQTADSGHAARELVKTAYEADAEIKLRKKSIAIHVKCPLLGSPPRPLMGIAWLSYMKTPYWSGCKNFTFATYPSQRIEFLPREAWNALGEMYERIREDIPSAKPVSHKSKNMVQGLTIDPDRDYQHLAMLKRELHDIIRTLQQVRPVLDMHCRVNG